VVQLIGRRGNDFALLYKPVLDYLMDNDARPRPFSETVVYRDRDTFKDILQRLVHVKARQISFSF
jgi:hypothetical protein